MPLSFLSRFSFDHSHWDVLPQERFGIEPSEHVFDAESRLQSHEYNPTFIDAGILRLVYDTQMLLPQNTPATVRYPTCTASFYSRTYLSTK